MRPLNPPERLERFSIWNFDPKVQKCIVLLHQRNEIRFHELGGEYFPQPSAYSKNVPVRNPQAQITQAGSFYGTKAEPSKAISRTLVCRFEQSFQQKPRSG